MLDDADFPQTHGSLDHGIVKYFFFLLLFLLILVITVKRRTMKYSEKNRRLRTGQ